MLLAHIQGSIADTLDPLQYAYRPNRSTSDTIAAVLHDSLSHVGNKDSYIRTLFVAYSSAFNRIIPHKLTHKLSTLGLHPTLCDRLLDLLTVRIGNRTSASIITTNIGTPQGCVLSLHPVHQRMCCLPQGQHHAKVCGGHGNDRMYHWWGRSGLQEGGGQSGAMVWVQQPHPQGGNRHEQEEETSWATVHLGAWIRDGEQF